MKDASNTYTNDTLATSHQPAAKQAFVSLPPPIFKYLIILTLCIPMLFTIFCCEKHDVVSEGMMMDVSVDYVRFIPRYIFNSASYPGKLADITLSTYPATYDSYCQININGIPLALFPKEEGTIVMCDKDVGIERLKH